MNKEFNKLKKKIIKHHKKWTVIYITLIFFYGLLLMFAVYVRGHVSLTASVFGLGVSIWSLSGTRTELKYQLRELKRLKEEQERADKRIMALKKQLELLKKENEEWDNE